MTDWHCFHGWHKGQMNWSIQNRQSHPITHLYLSTKRHLFSTGDKWHHLLVYQQLFGALWIPPHIHVTPRDGLGDHVKFSFLMVVICQACEVIVSGEDVTAVLTRCAWILPTLVFKLTCSVSMLFKSFRPLSHKH